MDASSKSENIAFFFQLERELEKVFSQVTKVNSFYLLKESELRVRSVSLLDKKRLIPINNQRLARTKSISLKVFLILIPGRLPAILE